MKWYNIETWFKSVRDALRIYLKDNGIKYELSQIDFFTGWHFEIYCDRTTAEGINNFLDSISIINQ